MYQVIRKPSLLIQGYIAGGDSTNDLGTYLRGEVKKDIIRQESLSGTLTIIITKEDAETLSWSCIPMTLFPWLRGSVILQGYFAGSSF